MNSREWWIFCRWQYSRCFLSYLSKANICSFRLSIAPRARWCSEKNKSETINEQNYIESWIIVRAQSFSHFFNEWKTRNARAAAAACVNNTGAQMPNLVWMKKTKIATDEDTEVNTHTVEKHYGKAQWVSLVKETDCILQNCKRIQRADSTKKEFFYTWKIRAPLAAALASLCVPFFAFIFFLLSQYLFILFERKYVCRSMKHFQFDVIIRH